jgi:hypothetical protein
MLTQALQTIPCQKCLSECYSQTVLKVSKTIPCQKHIDFHTPQPVNMELLFLPNQLIYYSWWVRKHAELVGIFCLLKSQVLITVPKIPNSVIKRYKDITRSYGKNDKKSGLASKISHRKQPVKNNREPYVLSDETRLCSPY